MIGPSTDTRSGCGTNRRDRGGIYPGDIPDNIDNPLFHVLELPPEEAVRRPRDRLQRISRSPLLTELAVPDIRRLQIKMRSLHYDVLGRDVRGEIEHIRQSAIAAVVSKVEMKVAIVFVEPPVDLYFQTVFV